MKKEQPQEAEVEEEDLEVASEEDFPVAEASVVAEVIKIVLSNRIFLCGACILATVRLFPNYGMEHVVCTYMHEITSL